MTVAGTVAEVDRNLLKLAKESSALLPALRKRFADERAKPDADAKQIAHLNTAIRELERAVARVRYQSHGEQTEAPQAGLQKSQKGEPVAGHKYTSRHKSPDGGWIYVYDDPDRIAEPHKETDVGKLQSRFNKVIGHPSLKNYVEAGSHETAIRSPEGAKGAAHFQEQRAIGARMHALGQPGFSMYSGANEPKPAKPAKPTKTELRAMANEAMGIGKGDPVAALLSLVAYPDDEQMSDDDWDKVHALNDLLFDTMRDPPFLDDLMSDARARVRAQKAAPSKAPTFGAPEAKRLAAPAPKAKQKAPAHKAPAKGAVGHDEVGGHYAKQVDQLRDILDDDDNGLDTPGLYHISGLLDAANDVADFRRRQPEEATVEDLGIALNKWIPNVMQQAGEGSGAVRTRKMAQAEALHRIAQGLLDRKPKLANLKEMADAEVGHAQVRAEAKEVMGRPTFGTGTHAGRKAPDFRAIGGKIPKDEDQQMMFSRRGPRLVLRKGHKYLSKKKDKHGDWIYEYPEEPKPQRSETAARQETLSAKLGGLKARLAEQRPPAGRTAPPAATPAPVARGVTYSQAKQLQRQAKNAPLAAIPGANAKIDQLSAPELSKLDAQLEDYIVGAFELQQKTAATDPELRQAQDLRGAIIRRQEQLRTAAKTDESGYPPEPQGRIADLDAAGLSGYLEELESYMGRAPNAKLRKQAELVRDAVKDRQIDLAEEEEAAARPPKTDDQIRVVSTPKKPAKPIAKMTSKEEVSDALKAHKAWQSEAYKLDQEDYDHPKNKKQIAAGHKLWRELQDRYKAVELDEREEKYLARPKSEQVIGVMNRTTERGAPGRYSVHLASPKEPIYSMHDTHHEALVNAIMMADEGGYKGVSPGMLMSGSIASLMHGAAAGARAQRGAKELWESASAEAERRTAAKKQGMPAMPPLGDSMARAAVQVANTQLARKQALEAAVSQIPNGTTFTIPKATGIGDLAGKWEVANLSPSLPFMHRVGKDESAKNMRPAAEFFGLVQHLSDQLPTFRAAYVPPVEKSLGGPRLVLSKGHKYTSKHKNSEGSWVYEYADAPWKHSVTKYTKVGHQLPPELYHGAMVRAYPDSSMGHLTVERHDDDGSYTIHHVMPTVRGEDGFAAKIPVARRIDTSNARLMIGRTIERNMKNHESDVIAAHRSMVNDAIDMGKVVPEEALADYPDLAEKYRGRVTKQPKKKKPYEGPEPKQSMMFSQAARGGSGRFTIAGTADHLGAHRREYHRRKEAGEIAGTRKDWLDHATDGWAGVKETHKLELLRDFRHLEADVRGLEEGPELEEATVKLHTLRTRLARLGHKV